MTVSSILNKTRRLLAKAVDGEWGSCHRPYDESRLWANQCEVAKEVRNVFLVHLTTIAYALMAVAVVRDRDFFETSSAGIELPLVKVQISPSAFVVVMPLLALLVSTYLQIYLGQLRRYQRRDLPSQESEGRKEAIDFDRWYPWIASFGERGGIYGLATRAVSNLLVWVAMPAVLFTYYIRLLPLRSNVSSWAFGPGLPPASLVGALAVLGLAIQIVWSAARRAVDAKAGLRHELTALSYTWRLVLCASSAVAVGVEPTWRDLGPALYLSYASLAGRPADGRPAIGIDLHGAELPRALLIGADLENANLRKAHLRGANLSGARLSHANLDGADLADATIENATLTGASLIGAHISGASFDGSLLTGASLAETYGIGASVREVDLDGADITDAYLPCTDFYRSTLRRVFATNAVLIASDFKDSRLEGALLSECSLDGSRFDDAWLHGAFLWGSTLRACELSGTHLEAAYLANANLGGAFADSPAYLQGTDFDETVLDGTTLPPNDLAALEICPPKRNPRFVALTERNLDELFSAHTEQPAAFGETAYGVSCHQAPRTNWSAVDHDACVAIKLEALRTQAFACRNKTATEEPADSERQCSPLEKLLATPPDHATWVTPQ